MSVLTRILNVSQIRNRVRTVIGRPASICCQCRAENPKPIMSSWVYLRVLRKSRTRSPSARKNRVSSITTQFLKCHARKHHEQNSCGSYLRCERMIGMGGIVTEESRFFEFCSSQPLQPFEFSNFLGQSWNLGGEQTWPMKAEKRRIDEELSLR
jgi:hypothetical protein